MKSLRASIAWLAISASACASNTAVMEPGTPPSTPEPSQPSVLFVEGNAQLVALPIAGTDEVAFRVMFYTGSIDDPKGKEGLTALTARVMAEGGTASLSYPELLRTLYPLAASISAQVDKEQTVFSGSVHKDRASQFIQILRDVIAAPRLGQSDFERIRQEMSNDIAKRLRAVDDENLGKEMLGLMLYAPEHPYGHYDGGTIAGLGGLTLEDVKGHAGKVFGRRRLVLGVAGAVSDGLKKEIDEAFAGLGAGDARVAEIPAVAKPATNEVLIAEKPGKAVAISIGYPHDAFRGHPDFSELGLVQSYFGEHRQFHGVLMSEMRERRGLNYGDYAYVEKFIQEGWGRNPLANIARRRQHFEIWIRPVDPGDAIFAIRLAMFYLDRLRAKGLNAEDVKGTATFLEGYTRLSDLTPTRKLGYALDEHFYQNPDYLEHFRQDLKTMTPESVNAAIAAHLGSPGLKIAIVAPDGEAMKKLLVEGAASQKKYNSEPPPGVREDDEKVSVFPMEISADHVRVVKVEELFER